MVEEERKKRETKEKGREKEENRQRETHEDIERLSLATRKPGVAEEDSEVPRDRESVFG